MSLDWQPIETAPRDGTEIIVWCEAAATEFVHLAWYRSPEEWEGSIAQDQGETLEDYVGWWSYVRSSVTQEKLDGYRAPKAWMPYIAPRGTGVG